MNPRKRIDATQLAVENKIKYHFSDPSVLFHALAHSSYANEMRMKKEKNNERLEFLRCCIRACYE
jgi:ribonuclease-3